MDKTKIEEVGGTITLCTIASCFGLVMLLGAAYFVGGMATLLVGVPCLIDRIFNRE